MGVAVLDHNDTKELIELWTKLMCLMEPDDGPSLDSADNKFSKVCMELNSWLNEKVFQHTGSYK